MATGGAYGKFLEVHDDGTVGKFYNPPYAAMINSLANIQVAPVERKFVSSEIRMVGR